MFTRSRRFTSSSSSSSSSETRPFVPESSRKKAAAAKKHLTKKRPALADVTNGRNASLSGARTTLAAPSKPSVPLNGSQLNGSRRIGISSSKPLCDSVSLDESMSTSDSLKSPEFEYIDNGDVPSIKSIENRTCSILNISDSSKIAGSFAVANLDYTISVSSSYTLCKCTFQEEYAMMIPSKQMKLWILTTI